MSETEYTLHTSYFDVVRTISIALSSIASAATNQSDPIEGIGFSVPATASPSFGSLVLGLPPINLRGNVSSGIETAEYVRFHQSAFGLYMDREISMESSCVVSSDFTRPSLSISQSPTIPAVLGANAVAEEFAVFARYDFDIWKQFSVKFAVQPVIPLIDDVSPVCCVDFGSIAESHIDYPYQAVYQPVYGSTSIIASSDINSARGDYDIGCGIVVQSVGITAEYVAANIKEIKFGSFVLPHSERKSEDNIKAIYNDRFNRLSNVNGAFNRPRAYERTITIHGETDKRSEYDAIHTLIGPKMALSVYGFYFPDCELTDIEITQRKPGLDRYPYTVTFIQRVFDTQDTASFAGLEFSNVVSVGEIKKSRISDDKYAKTGIAEPRAYQASVEIDCITEFPDEYSNAESRMGSIGDLTINGNTYLNAIITDISGIQQVGGGNAWAYTVSFSWFVFSASDNVLLGSAPLPNILEVSEEKRKPISDDRFAKAGISEPKAYQSDWTISGVFTTDEQFDAVDALIGSNIAVTINGNSYDDTRITDVSISQFRGGGSVRAYTISLSRYQFNSSDTVIFDNIGMQHVLEISDEKRTPISDEKYTRAGISEPRAYKASVEIDVITTNPVEYGLLESCINKSATLKINTNTYTKVKLVDLSKAEQRGGGSVWIYSASFEWYVFSATDTVTFAFGNIDERESLVLPNIIEVSEEKRTALINEKYAKAGISESRAFSFIRSITGIFESDSQYASLSNLINTSVDATINGNTYYKCRIDDIHVSQPRGGGDIWVYAVQISGYVFRSPNVVTINSISIPNVLEAGEEKISAISDDSYVKAGIAEPIAYSYSRTLEGVFETESQYNAIKALVNSPVELIINNQTYTNARLNDMYVSQPMGGGDTRVYTISLSGFVFNGTDTATFSSVTLPNILEISEEKRTPIIDDSFARAGVSEPRVYSFTRSISGIFTSRTELDNLNNQIGIAGTLIINSDTYSPKCRITDISVSYQKGSKDVGKYTASVVGYVFELNSSASFAGITLDNPEIREELRTPLSDERLIKTGKSEPKSYAYAVSVDCITTTPTLYTYLESQINQCGTLIINDKTYTNARITAINGLQPRGGGDIWKYTVSFICYAFAKTDTVQFGDVVLPNIVDISEDARTPIYTESFVRRGLEEPTAFIIKNTVVCVDLNNTITSTLTNIAKTPQTLKINTRNYTKSKITNISSKPVRGGGTDVVTIDFTMYWYSTTDTVTFNGLTLSNPTFPNAMDITPTYSVDMSVNNTLTTTIPKITRRYAFECITESQTEFETIVSWIGIRGTLVINSKTHALCHITMLSALQPVGGGNVWKYTIEFSRESGISPAVATFDGISLPNAVISSESVEILQNRTVLHTGKVAVDLGAFPSNRVSISCMSNSKTVYNQLYGKLGQKKTLVIDGENITKAYIAELNAVRIVGEGTSRIYTWEISFEQETV